MSKARRLYVLAAVAIPLAVAVAVLAWAGGNLRAAVVWATLTAVWSVFALATARKISRRQVADKTRHTVERTPRRRRMMVLERIFWLLMLVGSAAVLVRGLVIDVPLYLVLGSVWLIIVSGGQFFFVRVWSDE